MRIARLDLLRFGKFTDQSVKLPNARQDFHLIVGPNEAGKSTLRSAILDLLFGIETRSRYNFLHPHSEMQLGAQIEHGGKVLDFVRIKARTKSLRDFVGTILADDVLSGFIGAMERGFYEQMFGLDHERLVTGGREILDASKDVGQILFQSAAGIGSLASVRDVLEREADSLWAKRRSGDREYYQASDELEAAEAALKQATVRTKEWVAARGLVDNLEESLQEAREQFRALEQTRARLDRIRRVAPIISALRDREGQLERLGAVVDLSEDAGKTLAEAETAIALARQRHNYHQGQAEKLRSQLGTIRVDEAILRIKDDILAVFEQRQMLRNHPADIVKRQEEVQHYWKAVEAVAHELGWPIVDEGGLAGHIPSQLVRSAIAVLIRKHDTLEQALIAAEQNRASRQSDVDDLDAQLKELPPLEVSPALKDALNAARDRGDTEAQQRRLIAQLERAQRDLARAKAGLGRWDADTESLRALQLPSQGEIGVLQQQRSFLEEEARTLADRNSNVQSALNNLELEISQYQSRHHPVTLAALQQARGERDELWQQMKAGAVTPIAVAASYEDRVANADGVSDRRYDKAHEVSELQAKIDQRERLSQQLRDISEKQAKNAGALMQFDAVWEARSAALGLPGMPLNQASSWCISHERVLAVAETLAEADNMLNEFKSAVANGTAALRRELSGLVESAESLELAALISRATDVVDGAARMQEQRKGLTSQRGRAQRALGDKEQILARAKKDLAAWRNDWQSKLEQAHLPTEADPGTVQGALSLFARIDEGLQKMQDLRTNRIDAMERDLSNFNAKARDLVATLAPELRDHAADEVVLDLAQRLSLAVEAENQRTRLQGELNEAVARLNEAKSDIDLAQAKLDPLLRLARSANSDELRVAVQRSDQTRVLRADIRATQQSLLGAADGFARDALEAEFAAVDLAQVPGGQATTKAELERVVARQNQLAVELNVAQGALDQIAGQDAAARAESQRQEALARMANAVERYIKVHTAGRLLRWAIEQYRESKQGPMLSRAGEIFSRLTLGTFSRLSVDYDQEPVVLYGQRNNGDHVTIEGMSDGSRDQLYLALRLAAVELHLEQSHAMPFIADDLVINFDDARARAGLEELAKLSEKTQVIFLSHHEHLVPVAEAVFGSRLSITRLA